MPRENTAEDMDAELDDEEGEGGEDGEETLTAAEVSLTQPAPRGRPKKSNSEPPTPRPRGRPPGIASARTPEARIGAFETARVRDNMMKSAHELDALLSSLNFNTRKYEVRVTRIDPAVDENGVSCSGWLRTYRQAVTVDQIGQQFGGGTYEIKIVGPHDTTGQPTTLKTEILNIAGLPAPMPRPKDKEREKNETSEVLRAVTESAERSQQRVMDMLERNKDSSTGIGELLPVLAPVLEKLFSKNDDSLKAIMDMQREERRREEERRAEERRVELERRAEEQERRREEREEKRREDDRRWQEMLRAEERRREEERHLEQERLERAREERERLKEERDAERDRAREERERLRDEARADAAEKQRQHERDLSMQMERMKQDQLRQTEYMNMMQNLQQTHLDMIANRAETGGMKAVTEQLLMLKKLSGVLSNEGSDEPTTFEKFTEGFSNMAQTAMPLVQQIMAGRKQTAQLPAQLPAQYPEPQMMVQKPLMVDLGPKRAALPEPQSPPPAQAPAAEPVQNPAIQVNDLTQLVMPAENEDMTTAAVLLIKNGDFAVQSGFSAEQIVASVLEPFDKQVPLLMSMVAGMDSEQLVEFIEANVPAEWAILSPKGEELIVAAFELWQERRGEKT